MRRFTSLRSKLSVAITFLLQNPGDLSAPLLLGCNDKPSAGDNGSVAAATQYSADRTRLRNREHDDRQRRLAGKREGGRIHHLVAALDRLRMGQTVESRRRRICLRVG